MADNDETVRDPRTPSPTPEPPAPADFRSQIDELHRKSEAEIDVARGSMAQEVRDAETREREMGPLRQKQLDLVNRNIERSDQAERDYKAKIKEPPPVPRGTNQHDDETWLFAAGMIGALAGALTRNHASNALAAFSGAVQGYQEGSRQKFEQNMEIWNAENKKVIETNTQALNEYKEVLQNGKLTNDQMSVALQVAAAKYEDKAMITAARTKNSVAIAQLYDKQAQSLATLQESYNRLSGAHNEQKIREWTAQANDYVKSDAGQDAIRQMRSYMREPPPPNSRTTALGFRDQAIRDELSRDPAFDFGKFRRDQNTKKIEESTGAMAHRAAETTRARLTEARAAQVELITRTLGPVIELASQASADVPRNAFVPLNRLMQTADENLSNPKLKHLKIMTEDVANTFARLMAPGNTAVTNYFKKRADALISTADDPDAYVAALNAMRSIAIREYQMAQEMRDRTPMPEIKIQQPTPSATPMQTINPALRKAGEVLEQAGVPKTPKRGIAPGAPGAAPLTPSPDMPIVPPQGRSFEELFR